ncbi:hypothetical protein [Neorhizobium sp. DAR64872/K0K18]|uniref:hypothetical protein n=1 Tax=Neorhizobium sp. DAR64872/K0K18 TaxID=3421958 RepID=UPI003D2BA7D7
MTISLAVIGAVSIFFLLVCVGAAMRVSSQISEQEREDELEAFIAANLERELSQAS